MGLGRDQDDGERGSSGGGNGLERQASESLSMSNREAIESYVRQLTSAHGDARGKVLAAHALGNLASFLSERNRNLVPKKAMDLGVWQALLQALSGGFDAVEVEDAVVVAIAQLLVPPADAGQQPGHGHGLVEGLGAASRVKAVTRRMLEQLMEAFTVGQLHAALAATSNSRCCMAVARIVTLAASRGAIGAANELSVLESPLPKSLLEIASLSGAGAGRSCRDAAACGIASLHLAMASPACFHAALKLGMVRAFSMLYRRSIQADAPGFLSSADAMSLLARTAALKPWTHFDSMQRSSSTKRLQDALIDGGAVECLVSYMAVEAGNLKAKMAEAARLSAEALESMLDSLATSKEGAEEAAEAALNDLKYVASQIEEMEVAAPEERDTLALEELYEQREALREEISHVQAGREAREALRGKLEESFDFMARARDKHTTTRKKVKLSPPNLQMLKQVLEASAVLATAPSSANRDADSRQEGLTSQVR